VTKVNVQVKESRARYAREATREIPNRCDKGSTKRMTQINKRERERGGYLGRGSRLEAHGVLWSTDGFLTHFLCFFTCFTCFLIQLAASVMSLSDSGR
jgi:hypothetical protein